MRADHIIKYHTDHPLMTPKLVGIRITGGVVSPITQENILNGFLSLRNFFGQIPTIIQAKKSVAGFKLREGTDLLILVTIRNQQYLLNNLNADIIYNLLEDNMVSTEFHGNIRFGLAKKFGKAGVNIEFFVKGFLKGHRGFFFKSTLLIP